MNYQPLLSAQPGPDLDTATAKAPTAPPSPQDVELIKKQAAQYLAGWQRAKADYLNLKKQTDREREEIVSFAHVSLIVQLLPIYDSLKRGLTHVPHEKDTDWVKGFRHILNQFQQLFHSLGIEEIKTLGEKFNHDLHHALAREKRVGATPDTIVEEVKTGFTMHGKVIEPAHVRVAE